MKTNLISPIFFQGLKTYKNNGINIVKDFDCKTKDKNETIYNVSVGIDKNFDCYKIQFVNSLNSSLTAEQRLRIWPKFNYLFIDNMQTSQHARGKGLGTCMHLTGIIEMLENDVQKIELIAVPSAIPFHVKCGFKPDGNWNDEKFKENIRKIAKDKTPELFEYSQQARQLLSTYMKPDLKTKLANKLLYNYTKKAVRIKTTKEQQYMFPQAVSMTLTKKDVLKNKEFYNNLFDKYGIDYKI